MNCINQKKDNQPKMHYLSKRYSSETGNRTPVSRVTGGDTSHYTISDLLGVLDEQKFIKSAFATRMQRYRKIDREGWWGCLEQDKRLALAMLTC